MIAMMIPANGYLSQDSRVDTISGLHRELKEGIDSFSQMQWAERRDSGPEPAYFHHLFDRLSEEVSLLISGLEIEDHEVALVKTLDDDPSKKKHHRSKSMTVLAERYSILIDTLRSAAQAAADTKDWELTNVCSEFACEFEESLWFMIVYLQENLNNL